MGFIGVEFSNWKVRDQIFAFRVGQSRVSIFDPTFSGIFEDIALTFISVGQWP